MVAKTVGSGDANIAGNLVKKKGTSEFTITRSDTKEFEQEGREQSRRHEFGGGARRLHCGIRPDAICGRTF
jgi:hypothetical protein